MTDDWFSEFVYQIVADRKYISKELTDVFDHGKATVLPPWVSPHALSFDLWRAFSDLGADGFLFLQDPMGTLA